MEKSDSIKNIATALVKFNDLVGKIGKGSTNPFFKSKYAALPDILDAINEPLHQAGLTLNQFPTGVNGLTTIIIHADSGEYMLDTYVMTPTKNDPQGIGSCITYQRRYAIGAILNLNIDEDDDGNNGSIAAKAKEVTEPSTQQKVDALRKVPVQAELPTEIALTDAHKEAIAHAPTTLMLTSIWNEHKGLQANDTFINLIKERRAVLTAK